YTPLFRSLPRRQRHLTALILRKLLASSSAAVAATLDILRQRLQAMLDERTSGTDDTADLAELLVENEELETDLLDEILGEDEDKAPGRDTDAPVDRQKLREEIAILARLAEEARSIRVDTKSRTLLKALETGFEQMAMVGA